MNPFTRLRSLTRALVRRDRFERAMAVEIRFHIDAYVDDLVRAGVPRDEAARRAHVEFGGVDRVKEDCRQAHGLRVFDELRQDVSYGLRSLRRGPGFAIIAVAALAVGIGVNVAVFGIVNGVLLEALPYDDPQRLVLMFEQLPIAPFKAAFSPPDFEFVRDTSHSYAAMAAYRNVGYELSGVAEPRRLVAARISPELFTVLGVRPAIGRPLTEDDDRQDAHVAVLSHTLWSSAFGRDSSILGRTISLDRQPYSVVGIMPEGVDFPPRGATLNGEPADVLVPIAFSPFDQHAFGMMFSHTVVARLKPGISIEQARGEAGELSKALADRYPSVLRDMASRQSIPIIALNEEVVGRSRRLLLVLMGAVALVLLIGCADVANLMLTRSGSRQRELAIRATLGASRTRIVRQLLTEACLLAVTGSALGLALGYWTMRVLVSLAGQTLPRTELIAFDNRVVAFTAMLAVLTPLLFAVLPAFNTARGIDAEALKKRARSDAPEHGRSRLLGMLVIAQFALALMLVVAAGLLARSFLRLLATDPGFHAEHAVRVTTTLPVGRYATSEQVRSFYEHVVEATRGIPGVLVVGAGNDLPLNVRERRTFTANGSTQTIPALGRLAAPTWVTSGYLEALRVPLRQGRFFTDADGPTRQPVVIINELLGHILWPGGDPIGHQIKWGIGASQHPWMTIVGVVGNVKQSSLDAPTTVETYMPLAQESETGVESGVSGLFRTVNLVVRSDREADSVISDLRIAVQRLDPALPISKAQSFIELIDDSVRPQRFSMSVAMLLAALALGLAAIGIYAVLVNAVAEQAHEIGVRMALGATSGDVMQLVLSRALTLMAIGVGTGLTAALAVTRIMAGLLYQIRPTDAATFVAAALILAALALVASLGPAWHATRVDPLVVLRTE